LQIVAKTENDESAICRCPREDAMTEDLNGRLRLTAMTLRGIGSYLHGARLDFKPLTVLCGKNGSGKSTWLQVLDMLRTWSFDDDFPFRDIWTTDRRPDTHDFTNAAVKRTADNREP